MQQHPAQHSTFPMPQAGPSFVGDPFLSGVAGNVLRQQGQSYLQRGQAFVQSKMGFLSGGVIHYLFNVTPDYVWFKLLMLLAPFLKRWTYTRIPEQISGGHRYLPPCQDTAAPDLYIPLMALWTYCILVVVAVFTAGTFRPEIVYSTVSRAVFAWGLHLLVLKVMLYALGLSAAVPTLELAAYAGYPFTAASTSLVSHLAFGKLWYHAALGYGSLCMAIFLVRSMKRVIFQEARHYSTESSTHNYLLLGLALLQFPYGWWLSRLPS